jgi:predicted PurR-regulated permease PerM
VIAFAFNYIPFLGSFVATVLPTMFAVGQFDAWQNAITVFACLPHTVSCRQLSRPRIAGAVLAMPLFMVLFAVFFWTFLWAFRRAHRRTHRNRV